MDRFARLPRRLCLLCLTCLLCQAVFAKDLSKFPDWNPEIYQTEFFLETKGSRNEAMRMWISRVEKDNKGDPSLPNVFGGKQIKLRDKESDVIAKLDSLDHLERAAAPVRWTKPVGYCERRSITCYHYSLYSYILKNDPRSCILLYFSDDEYNLERFCLVDRAVPFKPGEEFFLYPNVYPADGKLVGDKSVSNWKKDIAAWNALSEYEQYFCMLSLPLISRNGQEVFSVNPEPVTDPFADMSESQRILESDWHCSSREDFIKMIGDFNSRKGFTAPLYESLSWVVDYYPGKTAEEISCLECLSMENTASLFFVAQMKKKLGEYGLLAWENSRALAGLRWSIGAGWLTEREAMQYARPLIDELLDCYASWDDYLAHYVIGRGFDILLKCYDIFANQYYVFVDTLKYTREYESDDKAHQLTFHGIKFPAKKQNGNPVLSCNDAWYDPSELAAKWEKAYALSMKNYFDLQSGDIMELEYFCGMKSKVPCAALKRIEICEAKGMSDKDILPYYYMALDSMRKIIPGKRGLNSHYATYTNFYSAYLTKAFNVKDYDSVYVLLYDLGEEYSTRNKWLCHLYSLYYRLRMEETKSERKIKKFKKRIVELENQARDGNYITAEDDEAQQIVDHLGEILRRGVTVSFNKLEGE